MCSHERLALTHVPQLFSWDCGLACVLMVLRGLGCNSCDYQQLRKLSQTTSVWTVDLAHLLARFGASVTFSTLTIGINDSFANEAFYMESLEGDEQRVQQLFKQAEQLGITIQQRSIPLAELAAAVGSRQQLAILLVDKRKLDPWTAAADAAWNLTTGVTSATGYTGHYVLLVGYEPGSSSTTTSSSSSAAAAVAAAAPDAAACVTGSTGASREQAPAAAGGVLQEQEQQQQHAQHQPAGAVCQQTQQQWPWWQRQDGSSSSSTPPGSLTPAGADPAAAAAAAAAAGHGHFWVHDPAKPRGPRRIPAAVVEAARKSFGTDEDVLLVQVAAGLRGRRALRAAVAGNSCSASSGDSSGGSGGSASSSASSSCHCQCDGGSGKGVGAGRQAGGGAAGGGGVPGSEQQQLHRRNWTSSHTAAAGLLPQQ